MISLDGGGIRGISSLLILRDLLIHVRRELVIRKAIPHNHPSLDPQDVFDLAAGTSTGGLIVLMLVKLNMSIDECLQEYQYLSKQIFNKQRPLWRRVFGSDISKFSADRLQIAVEDLLLRKQFPIELSLRCSSQGNKMQGSVLAHEQPSLTIIFFCTHECHGPYHHDMMNCELELRHATRATSAAPSYFKPATIRGRDFVDGGYGETNNPSWEAWWHYKLNHNLIKDQQLVMINIGTGTSPKSNTGSLRPKRPLWTRFVPNGIVSALGLMADLANMATESESPAIRLNYIAEHNPEQLSFERFSVDTGIDKIKLDDWQAATHTGGVSEVQFKTETYLKKAETQEKLKRAARALADVYVARQSHSSAVLPVEAANPNSVDTNQYITPAVPGPIPSAGNQGTVGDLIMYSYFHEQAPGLKSSFEPTESSFTSPPRTPEPFSTSGKSDLAIVTTEQNKGLFQGQGDQFKGSDKELGPLQLIVARSPSPGRATSRKFKRSSTLPPISSSIWESGEGD